MENFESEKPASFVEIKISKETNEDAVMADLLRGEAIRFVLTDKFDLYLSDQEHSDMRADKRTEISRGYMRMRDGEINIFDYVQMPGEIKRAIEEAVGGLAMRAVEKKYENRDRPS